MAAKVGVEFQEERGTDADGNPRIRYGFYARLTNARGVRKKRKIYSGPNEFGQKTVFASKAARDAHLNSIRARVAAGATIEQALRPYLGDQEADLVKACWLRFIDSHEAMCRESERPVTAKRMNELRGVLTRGYLDFFEQTTVHDLTSPMLVQWLAWLRKHWPAPPEGSKPGRVKPTEHDRQKGIRGFHRAKMRHHVVNDFLQFDRWLIGEGRVRPRETALVKPGGMPKLSGKRAQVPPERIVNAYLAAIPEELRGLFLARSIDGLRPAEARRMNVGNYDWRTGLLRIRRDDTKTDEGEASFIVDLELREWLEKWVQPMARRDASRPLFTNPRCWLACSVARAERRGKPITGRWTATAEKMVHDKACEAVGVYFPPNIFGRHAAATHMLKRSERRTGTPNVLAVQKKLRHSQATTTETYLDPDVIDTSLIERTVEDREGDLIRVTFGEQGGR